MSIHFFGRYLLAKQLISAEQLRIIVRTMEERNQRLGEVAIGRGMLEPEDADRIVRLQREHDLYFGEMAIFTGLLSIDQVTDLLGQQRARHVFLGEVAVELGLVEPARIEAALTEFHQQREDPSWESLQTKGHEDQASLLGNIFELTSRVLRRMAAMPSRLGQLEAGPLPRSLPAVRASIRIEGGIEMSYLLAIPELVARRLALELLGEPATDWEELEDVVGEFANVVVGNFVRQHERGDFPLRFSTPRCGAQALPEEREQTALWMHMATPEAPILVAVEYRAR